MTGTHPPGRWSGQLEEDAIVRDLRRGDEAAFSAIVARMHGTLLRMARVFVRDSGMAEEVVQETWLAVLKGINRFEERSSLKTWIFRILVNRAKTRARREGRMTSLSSAGGEEADLDAERFDERGRWKRPPESWSGQSPEELVLSAEMGQLIRKAIDQLPPAQRAVVTMRDVEELSSDEVCNILDISESNQRVILHRGRTRLRSILEKSLGGDPRKKGT